MHCPLCTAELPDDDLFCEACGAPLTPGAEPPACTCGAKVADIDEDGYCSRCGRLVRRPITDHLETALSPTCAAVSDRGLKHDRNEDRFAIRQCGDRYALVVCDGVSSSHDSQVASSTASETVVELLAHALQKSAQIDPDRAMRGAIANAQSNLAMHLPRSAADDPPSTTLVAALVAEGAVTVGWVGDSRAYWIDSHGARQLTNDHSWMNSVVSSCEMTAEEAERHPQAHAITRWLGADAGENATPDIARFPIAPPGILLLCTDGLWNYAPTPEAIAELVDASGEDALAVARHLVDFANAQGGHDNITAIVLQLVGDSHAQ
jgi:PPM family protein phosphatase